MEEFSNILWQSFQQNKDSDTFKSLFDIYYEPLCRYSFHYTKDRMDSEEVVLDFFTSLWEKHGAIRIDGSFEKYARSAVHNRSLNKIRSRKETAELEDGTVPHQDIEGLGSLDEKAVNDLVWEAVCSLPGKCQEIYLLSRKEGLSNKEIAARTGLNIKTVEGHLTKAFKSLREKLEKNL